MEKKIMQKYKQIEEVFMKNIKGKRKGEQITK